MKRDIYADLLKWKASRNRKPLILYGARQVGKTYILKEFGKNEFKNLVYINCYKNQTVEEIFKESIDVKRIILALSAYTGEEITSQQTLLFFDEAQEIPEVVASLKYFCEDARDLCVVAAGSLLGVMDLNSISFPTGKVNMLHMYPMTYLEFLEALDETKKVELLRTGDFGLIDALGKEYEERLRQYYFVGGMPEAVKEYAEHQDLEEVRKIQDEIINSYYSDIAKHAGANTPRCHLVFESLPSQLAKENKKFVFGALKKGARASEFEIAIQWLVDAGLVYKVRKISKVEYPISFYVDNDSFKLFLLDVGLLGALAKTPVTSILPGETLFKEYKGAFTENYVASQLATIVGGKDITYYAKENSRVEIDFIIQIKDRIYPIEVKAEENVRSKSLRQFIVNDNADKGFKGVRFSMKGYRDQDWMVNVPLYSVLPYLESPSTAG